MNRLHIGIFGRRNAGKSSLVNAIAGQQVAVVSEVAGTTTDAVQKTMEIPGLGPVVFIDTAGFDDVGELGAKRMEQTRRAVEKTDVAVVLFDGNDFRLEKEWADMFRVRRVPVIAVLAKSDLVADARSAAVRIEAAANLRPVVVSARTGEGTEELIKAIAEVVPVLHTAGTEAPETILGDLVAAGDTVMLVMPQDAEAPRGRLILPQAQTIRELLDRGCTVVGCQPDDMKQALGALKAAPDLIVTDSQAFAAVSALTPPESRLTSFSVLFARYKGDIEAFVEGVAAIDRLTENSRVLIAEACSHAPREEDIGRVKIPKMLRRKAGEGLRIDIVGGDDFPADLTPYDLVIHCGACMFNRRHVLSRVAQARAQKVSITNYGIAIAHLTGILGRVVYPE
jgi:[FeFe] hydrogenase H-cluster maturation GTPase HydF